MELKTVNRDVGAIQEIERLVRNAGGVEVVRPHKHRPEVSILYNRATGEWVTEAYPFPRLHEAQSLGGLIGLLRSFGDEKRTVVYVHDRGVDAVLDDMPTGDKDGDADVQPGSSRARLVLPTCDTFGLLAKGLLATLSTPLLAHALRVHFYRPGAEDDRGVSLDLLRTITNIKMRRGDDGDVEVSHGRAVISRSTRREMATGEDGAGIPEMVTLRTPVFVGVDTLFDVPCAVFPNVDEARVEIVPFAGAIDKVRGDAVDGLALTIADAMPGMKVISGCQPSRRPDPGF
jgi:hypothetical protein